MQMHTSGGEDSETHSVWSFIVRHRVSGARWLVTASLALVALTAFVACGAQFEQLAVIPTESEQQTDQVGSVGSEIASSTSPVASPQAALPGYTPVLTLPPDSEARDYADSLDPSIVVDLPQATSADSEPLTERFDELPLTAFKPQSFEPSADVIPLAPPVVPPPVLPPPVRTFLSYTPDGAADIAMGPSTPFYRAKMIAVFPKLSQYGFQRYISPMYMGIARSQMDADTYFAPLVAAGQANNIKFVPGFFLHDVIRNYQGRADAPPWNVRGSQPNLNHPQNPIDLTTAQFWNEFTRVARVMAKGAHSDQVYVDCEYVFWLHRNNTFFSDANLGIIREFLRISVKHLHEEGIFLILYHPHINPPVPDIYRIASRVVTPLDAFDPLNSVEHFVPLPYYSVHSWAPIPPEFVQQTYATERFNYDVVRFAFCSDHAFFPSLGLRGFTTTEYDTYCRNNPGVAERSWFFTAHTSFEAHAQQFQNIAQAD